jgi:tetratricopeptide (TPR) repeat protein
MTPSPAHAWAFRDRFRRHTYGWKSQPAIKRVKEAVSEIKKVAKRDPLLAAEGAVLFLEKVSPAIERVDSSSGAIGTAVNQAIETLAEIIALAPADPATRAKWLERLWEAYQADEIPYLESLGDHWGRLCASPEIASSWADRLIGVSKMAWSSDRALRGYFKGTTNCLSALLTAGRHQELLDLLDRAPFKMWSYRRYGAKALAAMGQKADAIRYAEEGRGLNDRPVEIARFCEEVLLSSGFVDEAYRRHGLVANRAGTYLAWFRAVTIKYPHKAEADVLADLVAHTPGDEGKWFAAAKSVNLFDEAIALANRTPCAPQTLTNAARDFEEQNPTFALEAGMAALRWLVEGYGYEITSADVRAAYAHTMKASEHAGIAQETRARIRELVRSETFGERFVTRVLGPDLGLR